MDSADGAFNLNLVSQT